jgi:biopolymer transport protein ExbB/TolQ
MSTNRKTGFLKALDLSFFLGAIGTVAFYSVVSLPSLRGTLLYHYTTEHVVEYVIVGLFIWGLADIALRFLSLPKEILALRREWLPARSGREPVSNAAVLLEQIRTRPRWLQESRVGRRLAQALEHVVENGSAADYRDHLQYLADQDDDVTHANYTLVRFVIAVSPILGFLGTVVHFGTALSGFSFDEMADKLPAIVAEMGTAFNTTTVALAAAMTMMFALFVCERFEHGIVRRINRLVERELLNRFEVKDANIAPFLTIVQAANQEALQSIAATLQRQIEVWSRAIDGLYERFDQRQQQESQRWHDALEVLRQRHAANDAERDSRLRQLVSHVDMRQDQHMAHVQAALDKATSFSDEIRGFVKTLDSIARGEGRLVELQAALTDNLRVLHETRQIDGALHGLTAAIHLLTARHRQGGIPDSAAA